MRDPDAAWQIPLNGAVAGRQGPEAEQAVWRTRDGGATWADLLAGPPQENVFFRVSPQAMATDPLASAAGCLGTNSAAPYASADGSGS